MKFITHLFQRIAFALVGLFLLGCFTKAQSQTISGYIKDASTGESLMGAILRISPSNVWASTNLYGFYSLKLQKGSHTVSISMVGYEAKKLQLDIEGDRNLDFDIVPISSQLEEVEITARAENSNVNRPSGGIEKISIKTVNKMPAMMGEVDVVRSILMLPGVSTVGEGAAGFNVRGGNVDQNLVLLDGIPIINSNHLFGFFSAFNADVIKDVTLYKGEVPAQYGSRASSVLNIKVKEGNSKKFSAQAGISPISSRIVLEGPIVNEKTTFVLAGRGSFADPYLNLVPNPDISNSSAYFYDFTGKINHSIGKKGNISLTTYATKDWYKFPEDTAYDYKTNSGVLRWNMQWKKNIFTTIAASISDYSYGSTGNSLDNDYRWEARVLSQNLKPELFWYINSKNTLNLGAEIWKYGINPGDLKPNTSKSSINPESLEKENSNELALYINDEWKLSHKWNVSLGLRYSSFQLKGPLSIERYAPDAPKDTFNIVSDDVYEKGKVISTFAGLEPRLSFNFKLNSQNSIKAGYTIMRQYLHLISNTSGITPIDYWKSSGPYISPQIATHYSIGYFKSSKNTQYEFSFETYYKDILNLVEYKNGADLYMNEYIDASLLTGIGKAYGIECMVKKNVGKVTGWLNYVYSRTLRLTNGEFTSEKISRGEWYPSNFDVPNAFKGFLNIKMKKRASWSFNYIYTQGRPITFPLAYYSINGQNIPHFELRNQQRVPDYHRLDVSLLIDAKPNSRRGHSWSFGLYNLYGRKNAYSIFFKQDQGYPGSFKLAVLGSVLPSFNYNFKF
ncbi:MAG: TonB-dependent receptor [Leadbetterella sp.]